MRKQMTARDFIEEVKMIADLKHIPVKIDETSLKSKRKILAERR